MIGADAYYVGLEGHEIDDQAELCRLYHHHPTNDLQFNRDNMRMAIRHGWRLASAALEVEVQSYRDMHQIATKELGYESILEALEAAPHAIAL